MLDSKTIIYALDLIGTASFAFSGALRAMRRRPDPVGMTILATATAIGGGAVRDILLNRDVVMLRDWGYPLVILFSVIVTFVSPESLRRKEKFFKYFDAVGLGIFSAMGGTIALKTAGMNPLSVLFVAAITGAGGGIIRDVLLNEMPLVLYKEIYITAVIVGTVCLMLVHSLGLGELAGFLAAAVVTTTVRITAIRRDWCLPRIRLSGAKADRRD